MQEEHLQRDSSTDEGSSHHRDGPDVTRVDFRIDQREVREHRAVPYLSLSSRALFFFFFPQDMSSTDQSDAKVQELVQFVNRASATMTKDIDSALSSTEDSDDVSTFFFFFFFFPLFFRMPMCGASWRDCAKKCGFC